MSTLSFDAKVSLSFINEMEVPSNFTAILNDRKKSEDYYTAVIKPEN